MILSLVATGQGALWIVVVPVVGIVILAAVGGTACYLWIWRGGRRDRPSAATERAEDENLAGRGEGLMFGYSTAGAPAWPRYVPFFVLMAVALLVGTWLHSLGFMEGVWSR